MKSKYLLVGIIAVWCAFTADNPVLAQGTAFTYQGRLMDGGNSANGTYDLSFTVYGGAVSPVTIGGPITNSAVGVTNGLFTVTLDFGGTAFPGADRWLEIAVRTNNSSALGSGTLVKLNPRQQLTSVPYAITAANLAPGASLSGVFSNTLSFSSANNQFAGDGSQLTHVGADSLGGLSVFNFWQLTGNAGTSGATNFLGTRDAQPLELRVNGVRGWRLEPTAGAPNIIGNPVVNFAGPGMQGATIGGGGSVGSGGPVYSNSVSANYSTIGGGLANEVQGNAIAASIAGGFFNIIELNDAEATIAGGQGNRIQHDADHSTITGGENNEIQSFSDHSVIGGGDNNLITGSETFPVDATIGGGYANRIGTNSSWSTIGGGGSNIASGFGATVPGGFQNQAAGAGSFAAGESANALDDHSFVWGDGSQIANSAGPGSFEVLAQGGINLYSGRGGVTVFSPGSLAFGADLRQMIDLWNTNYGIGVQNQTFYERTPSGFAWFLNGSHTNAQNDPGPGGTVLMLLSQTGDLTVTGSIKANGVLLSGGLSGGSSNAVSFTNLGNQFTGAFAGNGAGLTNLNASTVGGLDASNFWQLTGNSGTSPLNNFVGTRNLQPMEVRANNVRGWRLEPTADAPNIIGNPVVNYVSPGMQGVVIGGGGSIATYGAVFSNSVSAFHGTVGGGLGNAIQVNALESTIGGGNQNGIQTGAYRSVISGGFQNIIQPQATYSVIGGGGENVIVGAPGFPVLATIGGGDENRTGTNSAWSTIGGGRLNLVEGYENSATVAGGEKNVIHTNSSYGIISGGLVNSIGPNAPSAAIVGGLGNSNQAAFSFVGGGELNLVAPGATNSVIAGGIFNIASGPDTSIVGGVGNLNQAGSAFIGGGQFNLITPGGFNSVIGGGYSNSVAGSTATISGGVGNQVLTNDDGDTIGGGRSNTVSGFNSVVGGGELNAATGDHATIAGGLNNSASGFLPTVSGGVDNRAMGDGAVVGGGAGNLANGSKATVGGGVVNNVSAAYATIAGGAVNTNTGYASAIGGGQNNLTTNNATTIGGGFVNTAQGFASVIAGGQYNTIFATGLDGNHAPLGLGGANSAISGGYSNSITGNYANISGGATNSVTGDYSAIGGGTLNQASGAGAVIPGGYGNQAVGVSSFAAGQDAHALHDHSFVWGDGSQTANSTGAGRFEVLAQGGINLYSGHGNVNVFAPGSMVFGFTTRQMLNLYDVTYGIGVQNYTLYQRTAVNGTFSWFKGGVHDDNQNTPGAGGTEIMRLDNGGNLSVHGVVATSVNLSSDRNLKAGFEPVDGQSILEKVATMPITRWHYTNEVATPHVGPMAQDFQAAFNLGPDDRHISVVDEGGVALAAIQALNQKLEAEVKAKDARLAALEASVIKLQQMVERLDEGPNIEH